MKSYEKMKKQDEDWNKQIYLKLKDNSKKQVIQKIVTLPLLVLMLMPYQMMR
jgi:hypothetical protein